LLAANSAGIAGRGCDTLSPVAASLKGPPQADVRLETEALARRAREGDRGAFGEIYDRFAPLLLGVAARILGDRREAHDLVHDVFLEAWQHIREYDVERGSLRTWLLLRLRSRALDRLGRAEGRYHQPLDDLRQFEGSPSPVRISAVDEFAVRRALSQLETDVREVLECTYFGGLTAREIAERSGIPVGTVKSRLARGLAALQAVFDDAGSSDG
jgi:RNA polymerase sigma-70 factor, ECF subfamily